MSESELKQIILLQDKFFNSRQTLDLNFRLETLRKLKALLIKYEENLFEALKKDLGKPPFESYTSETGMILQELNLMIKKLKKWASIKKVKTPIVHFIAHSYYKYEPYGRVLIISPWNYPFQLLFNPLIGAIAAGNCVLAKPSQHAVHTGKVLGEMINNHFDPKYIHIIQGGKEINQILLGEKFDYIFFTGSSEVGKTVMKAAAENLTPFSLELGGKNPVIVTKDAHLKLAAKRILWGKMLNAGQSCVAPDYIMADEAIKDLLLAEMKSYLINSYGTDPVNSSDYCKIINGFNTERLKNLITKGNMVTGGNIDVEKCYVQPTIIDNVSPLDPVMQEEVFGPILPVLTFKHISEAITFIKSRPRPLALYLFTRSKDIENTVRTSTQSGTLCINETVVHFVNPYLPFGGVGKSGMGRYHGRFSFETFSYKRSYMKKSNLIDNPIRYPPYKNKLKLARKFIR